MMAERLNAADCKSVPMRYVGSNPTHLKGKEREKKKMKKRIEVGLMGEKKRRGRQKKRRRREPKYRRGKPRKGERERKKAREKGLYGCGKKRAKEVCGAGGRRGKTKVGRVKKGTRRRREKWRREKKEVGTERKKKEEERRKKKRKRGTVRGVKRRRGLPVRGQRTQTNGKTARKLNGRRR